MDLTWGNANSQFLRGDPYNNLVYSLQRPAAAIVYAIGSIALGIHLYHGAWSMFQSLGITNPRYNTLRRRFAAGVRGVHDSRQPQLPGRRAAPRRHAPVPAHETDHGGVPFGLGEAMTLDATLDSKTPAGPIEQKWDNHKFDIKLVNPANKRRFEIVVVGTGLAGASAAATLGELGYRVKVITFHDSPRRAHSIAAQGGINAAKNYPNDGDSVYRLFYDTMKGGDYRSREANVYRLAQVSVDIIDQCVAQGVPFAREYGGLLDNRSFGGAQVSRTFYARGQTGQQLLLGAYQSLMRQVQMGNVTLYPHVEMLDLVVKDGRAAGIVCRDLETGEVFSMAGHAVVLATGGYGNAFYLSTNAKNSNVTAAWRAAKRGAYFANPCYTQIHPTCIPASDDFQSKLTLMSESLRNDGRVWVPQQMDDPRSPDQIPEGERDYLLERRYPSFGNLVRTRRRFPRDQARGRCGPGCGPVEERRLPRPRRRDPTSRPRRHRRALRKPASRCTSASPTRTPTSCPCGSIPPSTTRWAGSGSTTTS